MSEQVGRSGSIIVTHYYSIHDHLMVRTACHDVILNAVLKTLALNKNVQCWIGERYA